MVPLCSMTGFSVFKGYIHTAGRRKAEIRFFHWGVSSRSHMESDFLCQSRPFPNVVLNLMQLWSFTAVIELIIIQKVFFSTIFHS